MAASQAILGVKPQFDGLMIDPCLPADIRELEITRRYRGNEYKIHVTNLSGGEKGKVSLKVDGEPIEGQTIRTSETGKTIRVEVVIA